MLVDEDLKRKLVEVRQVNDRLVLIILVIGVSTFNVISAYDPQIGLGEEEKKRF